MVTSFGVSLNYNSTKPTWILLQPQPHREQMYLNVFALNLAHIKVFLFFKYGFKEKN